MFDFWGAYQHGGAAFLFCNNFLFFHHQFHKQDTEKDDGKRDSGKDLLTVHRHAENGIAVFLHGIENTASEHGGGKSAKTAYAVFDSGCLNEIFTVDVIVRQVDQVLACAGAGDVIDHRIENDEPPKRRRSKNIDEIADGGDRHAELDSLRVGALVGVMRDGLREARADQTARDIDDLHRADREKKLLGLIRSHKADGHINGNGPDAVDGNGIAKALVGKQRAHDLCKRLRFLLRLSFRLLIFHAHQTDEVSDGKDQHHGGSKEKAAFYIACLNEAVDRPPHGKADGNARNEGNDLLGRREIRASARLDVGVAPVEDNGGHEVVSEIRDEQAPHHGDNAKRPWNIEKRKQVEHQKEHLAYAVDGDRHQLDIADMLYDENGAKLEQERQRDQ